MANFLSLLSEHTAGILVLLLLLFALAVLIQWTAWLLQLGRFRHREAPSQAGGGSSQRSLTYLAAELLASIINEFRHLLALMLVGVFTVALFVAMWPGMKAGNMDDMKDGVQAVAAALGGLIGSIIGYYFGESAASRPPAPPKAEPSTGDITPVQRPASLTPTPHADVPPGATEKGEGD